MQLSIPYTDPTRSDYTSTSCIMHVGLHLAGTPAVFTVLYMLSVKHGNDTIVSSPYQVLNVL